MSSPALYCWTRRYGGWGPATDDRGLPQGWALAVEPQTWEAPVIGQRTSVGLDVHARSVVGCGLDEQTGEVLRSRLTPGPVQGPECPACRAGWAVGQAAVRASRTSAGL